MTSFDPTQPVQTRDGLPARIICDDRNAEHRPIVALILDRDHEWISCHRLDGQRYDGGPSGWDLVNVSQTSA